MVHGNAQVLITFIRLECWTNERAEEFDHPRNQLYGRTNEQENSSTTQGTKELEIREHWKVQTT